MTDRQGGLSLTDVLCARRSLVSGKRFGAVVIGASLVRIGRIGDARVSRISSNGYIIGSFHFLTDRFRRFGRPRVHTYVYLLMKPDLTTWSLLAVGPQALI